MNSFEDPTSIYLPVLDKGYVQLVAFMGDDLSPLESARMSTNNPTGVDESKDDRLRTRLWGDQHTSPFESLELHVELKLPLFVLRQIDRHRTISTEGVEVEGYDDFRKYSSRNEFSGRYAVMPDEYYVPPPERFRRKGKNKQGSDGDSLPMDQQKAFARDIQDHSQKSREAYEIMVQAGVSTEIARMVLPGNQYTKIRLKANGLNWLKFLNLRLRPDVQEETRDYAVAIARIFKHLFPKCWGVFEESTLYGVSFNQTEAKALLYLVGCGIQKALWENSIGDINITGDMMDHLESKLRPVLIPPITPLF